MSLNYTDGMVNLSLKRSAAFIPPFFFLEAFSPLLGIFDASEFLVHGTPPPPAQSHRSSTTDPRLY